MSEKEVIEKKLEELAKEVAATGPVEKKQDIETWMYIGHNSDTKALIVNGPVPKDEHKFNLVRKTDYNLIAGENKALKRELQKLADLLDEKNKAIDEMAEEKQVVALSLYDESQARVKLMRAKLKKLNAWGGE